MAQLTEDVAVLLLGIMFILTFPIHVYRWLRIRGCVSEVRRLMRNIKTARQEALELNTPETFVRYAKLNRLIAQKQKRVQDIGETMKDVYQCKTMTRILFLSKVIVCLGMLGVYGNVAIVQLGYPVKGIAGHLIDRAVDEERCAIGEVRLLAWLFLANAASNACVHALMPINLGDMLAVV